ncbi:MAG: hypothetical protein ACK40E_03445 [Caldimicrobium sp.]
MKIDIEGSIIKLIPENEREIEELNKLWQLLARCEEENRKLLPLGHFVPQSTPYMQFYIEGLNLKASYQSPKVRYICMICNRMEEYPEEKPTPICCGQPMYKMD